MGPLLNAPPSATIFWKKANGKSEKKPLLQLNGKKATNFWLKPFCFLFSLKSNRKNSKYLRIDLFIQQVKLAIECSDFLVKLAFPGPNLSLYQWSPEVEDVLEDTF